MQKRSKITILGAGNVGATIAYTLTIKGIASEIVLIDINKAKAAGEAMDIAQGAALCPPVSVMDGDYPDAAGSDIVVVTLGAARKPGQTRTDLAQGNVNIIKSVMPQALKYAPDAIYVVVSNPVDIITYAILKTTGLPESQVFGSGTLLDTVRLRAAIADDIDVDPKSVHAYVFGEHGDSSMIPWSLTAISSLSLDTIMAGEFSQEHPFVKPDKEALLNEMHRSGAEVIKMKGATFYAIALTTSHICDCILHDSRSLLTVSTMMHGEYGVDDVCVSLPALIGRHGISNIMQPQITDQEIEEFRASAGSLKNIIKELTF